MKPWKKVAERANGWSWSSEKDGITAMSFWKKLWLVKGRKEEAFRKIPRPFQAFLLTRWFLLLPLFFPIFLFPGKGVQEQNEKGTMIYLEEKSEQIWDWIPLRMIIQKHNEAFIKCEMEISLLWMNNCGRNGFSFISRHLSCWLFPCRFSDKLVNFSGFSFLPQPVRVPSGDGFSSVTSKWDSASSESASNCPPGT